MFTPKDVKRHIDLVIEDIDAGSVPRRPGAPRWIRALAGPAALGLACGLGACATDGGEPPIDRAMAQDAKADGFDICWLLDLEEGCDVCEELGWYGDGICDDFCDRTDPDCGPIDCGRDGSCPEGMQCDEDDRGTCPPGAYCIMAPTPGMCVPAPEPEPEPIDCNPDGTCPEGMQCDEHDASTCPEGAYCILPPSPGVCRAECDEDADCAAGETCEGEITCPEGAHCILAPRPGMCTPTDRDA